MTFGLGTFDAGNGAFPGIVIDDLVHDLSPHLEHGATTRSLFEDWDTSFARLSAIASTLTPDRGITLSQLRALLPVNPAQVFCAGANYYTHTVQMTEMVLREAASGPLDEEQLHRDAVAVAEGVRAFGRPFVFSGQLSALSGADDDIVLWGPGTQHDWELEVAVVIGRRAERIAIEDAMTHVAGYAICNDISTRDVMFRPGFALSDFLLSKNRPTFFPFGPYIVPSGFVPDYRELEIRLDINGEPMQRGRLDDLIYSIEELVTYLSHAAVLLPGDIVLTGTPDGNAAAQGNRWLAEGDVIESSVTGLGTQTNRCVPDPAATAGSVEQTTRKASR